MDAEGRQIWNEVPPRTETIPTAPIDLVWKPVGFVKRDGYDIMHRRCLNHIERPFAYCHFEYIHTMTTKPGLIRALKEYYTKTDMFRKAGYTVQHTMAMSFIIPVSDCIASRELNALKKLFKRIENHHAANESLPLKQLEKNMWIIKPENLNRGQGIEIAYKFGEILNHIHTKQHSDLIVV